MEKTIKKKQLQQQEQQHQMQWTIMKKMAACTFYQNELCRDQAKMTEKDAKKNTYGHKINKTKKITSNLMLVLQQTSTCFLK